MKLVFDTSILVEIDRHNSSVIHFLQKLIEQGEELLISTVTVAEILTGSYLHRDAEQAVLKAKEVLNQFTWKEVDGEVAQICGKLYAYVFMEKKEASIEYPDVLIAATFLAAGGDLLITLNKKDFLFFPQLKGRILTPDQAASILRKVRD